MKKALLICGGEVKNTFWLARDINRNLDDDTIIYAVDSGANTLADIDVIPHICVGDSDSIYPGVKKDLIRRKVEMLSYKPEKDYTDTELAMRDAVEKNVDEIIFYAATGGRIDHFVANLFMLEIAEDLGVKAKIVDEINTVCYLGENTNEREFKFVDYKYCSLLPLTDNVSGLSATNMKYPVENIELKQKSSRGVSNEIISEDKKTFISKKTGTLFVIASKDRV